MGKALTEAFPICGETFAEADAALGASLSRVCFEGPDDQLALTENTQPAILAVSIAAHRLLASRGLRPSFVAGHSLGEYSANVTAGTFSSQVGSLLSRRAFRRFRRRVDYSEYGGAPLMGVAGLCIVGHGRSSAKAVRNAVVMASRFANSHVLERVEHEIAAAAV